MKPRPVEPSEQRQAAPSEEGEDRLSVFQDFFEKLDLDNEDEEDEGKDK